MYGGRRLVELHQPKQYGAIPSARRIHWLDYEREGGTPAGSAPAARELPSRGRLPSPARRCSRGDRFDDAGDRGGPVRLAPCRTIGIVRSVRMGSALARLLLGGSSSALATGPTHRRCVRPRYKPRRFCIAWRMRRSGACDESAGSRPTHNSKRTRPTRSGSWQSICLGAASAASPPGRE
jgi:hypothetical protein